MPKLQVREFVTDAGDSPFRQWILSVDRSVRGRVHGRLERFAEGRFGENRHLGQGLCEAKLDFGPGYRIYFGILGQQVVILLLGGDKSSQAQDILKARRYWEIALEEQS